MFVVLMVGMPVILLNMLLQSQISVWGLRYYLSRIGKPTCFSVAALPLFGVITILMLGNFMQIALWGLLFWLLGEFETMELAVYHSGVNFATLGYGDIVMTPTWRLLGPLEAVNGALMIGLSGATMLAVLQHQLKAKVGVPL